MTPSPTPQRKKKDDYDHPLRRSPRGEAAAAAQADRRRHSPAQLAVERAAKLEAIPFDRANYETVTTAAGSPICWRPRAIRGISPSG